MSVIKSITRIFFVLLAALLLTFGIVGLAPAHALSGATWYVANTGSDDVPNSCADPGAPCLTINAALGKATAGDTVLVAAGTYTDIGALGVVDIEKNITLSGGWNAGFTTQSSTSIIDGQGNRRGMMLGNTAEVTVVVDHFTFQNGFAYQWSGGAIFCSQATLTLSNSIISNNVAEMEGAGIFNGCQQDTMTINNSIITGNHIDAVGFIRGGGIMNYGTMILNNSVVSANSIVRDMGGGIASQGNLTLNNSTVTGNTNIGIVNDSNYLTLNNSTVSGNADGGIYSEGYLTLNNSTISSNSGYGVNQFMGRTILANTTISGNDLGVTHSGSYSPDIVILQNSIVAGNQQDCSGMMSSAGYNLIGNTSSQIEDNTPLCNFVSGPGDLTNVSAQLGPLTGSPAYLPLLVGSPAIDAGNPAAPGSGDNACLVTDQRGMARPQGSACDMGSYEWFGHVVSGNAGVAGAVLSYHDDKDRTVIADGSGNYAFRVLDGWNGVVTPIRLGYSFSPASIDYSVAPGPVTSDLAGQDYQATRTGYGISGNAGVAGATLSYDDAGPHTATADSSGNYAFAVSINWSGTVTPFKTGTRFVPVNKIYTNLATDLTAENYTAYVTIPVPSAPAGRTSDPTPTYKWSKVPGATKYQYQLVRGATIVYSKTVSSAVCKSSTCSNTPVNVLANGAYKWRIRAMIGGTWQSYSGYTTFTILVPNAGFWSGDTSFYVTPGGVSMNRYTIHINVAACGIYNLKLVYNAAVPIVNGQYKHNGAFFFSGTFRSAKISTGSLELNGYMIYGCGPIYGGPFAITDIWRNSSQSLSVEPEMFTLTVGAPEAGDTFTFYNMNLVHP